MKIFRASYSTLSQWAAGNYDRAIEMYFHVSKYDTEAMAIGRALHDAWDKEIKSTGCMPTVFGGKPLHPEYKAEVFAHKMIAPWLQLRGRLDLIEPTVGRDWKSGVTTANTYANSMQHSVYQILYPQLKRFEYHAVNPYVTHDQVTMAIVHLSPRTLRDGIEWVVTHASAMKDYIESNNLEDRFAKLLQKEAKPN